MQEQQSYTQFVASVCEAAECSPRRVQEMALLGQALDLGLITVPDVGHLTTLAPPELDGALLALAADVWLAQGDVA